MTLHRTTLAALLATLGVSAQAQPADKPASPLATSDLTWQQCQKLAGNNEARLACFDRR